jgi:hypothetical protein
VSDALQLQSNFRRFAVVLPIGRRGRQEDGEDGQRQKNIASHRAHELKASPRRGVAALKLVLP